MRYGQAQTDLRNEEFLQLKFSFYDVIIEDANCQEMSGLYDLRVDLLDA